MMTEGLCEGCGKYRILDDFKLVIDGKLELGHATVVSYRPLCKDCREHSGQG